MSYPQRVVCLAAEAADILERLHALDRVVAVSVFARHSEAIRSLPKVGGFATPDLARVVEFEPDLVITTSDVQADAAAGLVRRGIPVLALAPSRLAHVWQGIRMIGGVLGLAEAAETLVADLQAELNRLRAEPPHSPVPPPRVYFEEWFEPLISGVGWVSDLIAWVGGCDIFAELAAAPTAQARVVSADEVIRRAPQIVIASWCGRAVNLEAIKSRPGWSTLPAVQDGRVYEVPSDLVLQAGPTLVEGARRLSAIIRYAGEGDTP